MVDFRRLSITFETHWDVFTRDGDRVRAVMGVVMGVRGQFDHVHVGVIGSSVVAGLHSETFTVVCVGGLHFGEAQFREKFVFAVRWG